MTGPLVTAIVYTASIALLHRLTGNLREGAKWVFRATFIVALTVTAVIVETWRLT